MATEDAPPSYRKPQRSRRRDRPNSTESSPGPLTPTSDTPGPISADDYPLENYTYGPRRTFVGAVLLLSDVVVFAFLAALVFAPPSTMGGGAAVLKNGQGEFVGVLRKCSATSCDPWMGGGGGDSSTGTDSSSFSLPDMFLTTGLASLSALWLSIYILICTTIRIFTSTPDNHSTAALDGFKRFIYRASRVFLVVNVVLVPSLVIDVIVKAMAYGGSVTSTVGGGVVLIVFAFLFTILSLLIELGSAEGKVSGLLLKLNCPARFCGCCVEQTDDDDDVEKAEKDAAQRLQKKVEKEEMSRGRTRRRSGGPRR